jgi:hypothetical protein
LLAAEAHGIAPTAQRYAIVSATVMQFMTSIEVTRMLIVAEMNRASKKYVCSKCRAEIRRGELYILWRSVFYSNYTERYCLRCAAKDVELMLKHSVKRLRIYVEEGEDYTVVPVKDAPLPEEWRKRVEVKLEERRTSNACT